MTTEYKDMNENKGSDDPPTRELCVEVLNYLVREFYLNSKQHGFWEPDPFSQTTPAPSEKIALMHAELSEALEEFRKPTLVKDEKCSNVLAVTIELADAFIRIGDLCGCLGLDFGEAVMTKHEYNKGRPYKHGKKF